MRHTEGKRTLSQTRKSLFFFLTEIAPNQVEEWEPFPAAGAAPRLLAPPGAERWSIFAHSSCRSGRLLGGGRLRSLAHLRGTWVMAGFTALSDEDRRWAASTHNEETVFRGPFGRLFVCIDQAIDKLRGQSPIENVLLAVALFLACAMGNILLEDETVSVLVRGGKACAADKDLLDQGNQRCRVVDKFALGYLKGQAWVNCAGFTTGAKLLQDSQDYAGHFWYPVNDKAKVNFFYSTCAPTCASAADAYRPPLLACKKGVCDGGMCQVRDRTALKWLEAKKIATRQLNPLFHLFSANSLPSGVVCEPLTAAPGLVAVEQGTLEAEKQKSKKGETMASAEFYYDPQLAEAVRLLYEGCDGPCACNDQYLQAQHRCSITDEDVRVFFDPARGHPRYTNAYCAQRAAAPIHAHGDLQGGWQSMTYDPAAKAGMVSLYKTCAKHVPCP